MYLHNIRSVVEGAAYIFVCFLFLTEHALEALQVRLHVPVDLEVASDNFLHLSDVLVDVSLLAVPVLILEG